MTDDARSERRTAGDSTAESTADPSHVLLLMAPSADRRLLEDWLGRDHRVTTGDGPDALDCGFDLCLVDVPAFARHADAIAARKARAAPAFLPFLLLLDDRPASAVDGAVWEHVDEVVSTPIDTTALRGRLRGLLVRRELSTALARREADLRRILRAVPDPVIVVDDGGTIVKTNPALGDYTGADPGRLVGSTLRAIDAFSPETVAELTRIATDEDAPTGGEGLTITYRSAVGTTRSAEVEAAALPGADGEADRTLLVLRDVTDRVDRQRALEREAERLAQFADMLAHEIRNPLNVAQGFLDRVTPADDASEAAKERVSVAHRRMAQMITELLAHARGSELRNVQPVELARIARTAWEGTETGDATLDVPAEGATVEADPERLQTLLENLFRNAREHAGPDVAVRVGPVAGGGFFVEDDGPGVPPTERERVFERGYTTDSAGTGLGLVLVAQIADAHDWAVALVESDAGGARFEFVPESSDSGTKERSGTGGD